MNDLQITPSKAEQSISQKLGLDLTPEQVAVIKASVAKSLSDSELAYFLSLSNSVGLNPFTKQIWAYKDGQGNLLVFAGRDGFLANAQRHADFDCIRSAEVRENDEFAADVPNGVISHKITSFAQEQRGAIVGAYAIVKRKGKGDSVVVVEFKTYNRGIGAWKTHPADMICKVAETKALKKAFGLELQSEYEFDTSAGIAVPITNERKPKSQEDEWKMQLIEAFDKYQGEDKEDLAAMAQEKFKAGEADEKFVNSLLEQLQPKVQQTLFDQQ